MSSSRRSANTCAVDASCAGSCTGGSTGGIALLERGTQAREHALVLHVRDLFAAQLGEGAHELVFLGREAGGDLDVDAYEQVAASAPAQRRDAAALEPEDVSGLRARRDDQLLDLAVEGLDVEVRAERRLAERDLAHV